MSTILWNEWVQICAWDFSRLCTKSNVSKWNNYINKLPCNYILGTFHTWASLFISCSFFFSFYFHTLYSVQFIVSSCMLLCYIEVIQAWRSSRRRVGVSILVCRISVYTKYVCMLNYPTDYSLSIRKMCNSRKKRELNWLPNKISFFHGKRTIWEKKKKFRIKLHISSKTCNMRWRISISKKSSFIFISSSFASASRINMKVYKAY